MNSIIILGNGAFPTEPYPLYLLETAEGVVCCDGALAKYLEQYPDRRPLAVVGDLDSLPQALKEPFSDLIFQEAEQDDNDQTKALRWVLTHHPEVQEIVILGATGLREDHTIGNLGLLMDYPRQFDLGERKLSVVSDYGTAFVITDSCDLHLGEGRRFSLFSADNSLRITSTGLQWPLDGMHLHRWWNATLNAALADSFELTTDGEIIVFRTYDPKD